MPTMYASMGNAFAVLTHRPNGWQVNLQLQGTHTQCVAADPLRPEVVYCGTFGQGLWKSADGGKLFRPVGSGIASAEVMAVAVSPLERVNGNGVVWAGTEPSRLFRSEDGGQSWREMVSLTQLPSAASWRFPPRPWTHHVRWIQPDPNVAERLYVAIELGGVMRSLDGGVTWEDRKPNAQPDAHTLRCPLLAPGRVYESAGGGFAQSDDGGATWQGADAGLAWHYLWGLAVDPADPDTLVVSASPGARQAHNPAVSNPAPGPDYVGPESTIYRRTKGQPWHEARAGLPSPRGTLAYVLAAHPAEPHVFYAATHQGQFFRSADAGLSWEHLAIAWPSGYTPARVEGLVAVDAG